MRTGTLTRTRIFRADPALDAALEAGAAREGVTISTFLREALRSALGASNDPRPPSTPATPAVAMPMAA
ncbi:CopG family transcriptional regulator [Methylobacterium mesophilicum]